MRPDFSRNFTRDYQRLPQRFQEQFDKALRFLLSDHRHPSLKCHKMGGQHDKQGRDIGEARISGGYRFTFVIEEDTYILRRIGKHDILDRP